MELAERMGRLGTESAFEVLARAKALEAQGVEVVHLEIGEPDFETAPHIKAAAIDALNAGFTHYVPTAGITEVRQAVARNAGERRGLEYEMAAGDHHPRRQAHHVLHPAGARGARRRDHLPGPRLPIYASMVNFCGAKPVPMPLRGELDYHPDLDEFASLVNENTRLVILNSPHNPCGSVLSAEEIAAITEIVRDRSNAYVLSDEVYKDLRYTGSHVSIAAMPGMQDRTIILDGLSKSYAMTGWRLGYGVFPAAARRWA